MEVKAPTDLVCLSLAAREAYATPTDAFFRTLSALSRLAHHALRRRTQQL